jgi:hypothetical protein
MSDSLPDLLKLKRWMEEYVLDRRMGEESVEERAYGGESPDFSGESAPAEYQIRLWPAAAAGAQPVYGLVRSEGYGRWCIFPFSPYAFPAIPEELRVLQDPPVRVVQGWNIRSVPTGVVAASWQVSELPKDQRLLFERWWVRVQSGDGSDGDGDGMTGPALLHPLDPRHGYLDHERKRVDAVLGETQVVYDEHGQQKAAEPAEEDEYPGDGPPYGGT